jgi:enoyl-CoA hydratase/carnithine racemase
MACELVVASPNATFSLLTAARTIAGGPRSLSRLPLSVAWDSLTDRRITAEEALGYGMVNSFPRMSERRASQVWRAPRRRRRTRLLTPSPAANCVIRRTGRRTQKAVRDQRLKDPPPSEKRDPVWTDS